MSTATQELRFRPLGRGTFVGGFFVTILIHVALAGLVWYGSIKAPVPDERPRDIITIQSVKLGKKRDPFWLPRIEQPPPPKVVEPEIKIAMNPEAPPVEKEKEKEKPPKPEKPEYSKKVQDVLNRRRFENIPDEPPEGQLNGSVNGTAATASEGDAYATLIRDEIRAHWNVPTGLSIGEVINFEAEVRISLAQDGTILEPKLRKSSGNTLYDDSCMQAVQATRKVPPPPPALRALYRKGIIFPFGGKDLAH